MRTALLQAGEKLRQLIPDPFVMAVILSGVTIEFAYWNTECTRIQVVEIWGKGFWNLAAFTLQMVMILLGGYVVAVSPAVKRGLLLAIQFVRTPVQAVLFCTLVSMAASWLNWGLGLVVGGIVALEVGKQCPRAPFRLLVASSYSGFLVWHAGLSGSIPLKMNMADGEFSELAGGVVPLSETIFCSFNLIALASLVILLPLLNLGMLYLIQTDSDEKTSLAKLPPDTKLPDDKAESFLENSILLPAFLILLGGLYFGELVRQGEFRVNLNTVNLIIFLLGLLLHGSPHAFMKAVTEATPKIAPILILYPLYSAIMAVLKDTGLGTQMAEFFVNTSTADTFPLMTFLSAGLINFFVPSGGGQWAVQAPVVLPAAEALGADMPKTMMAVAWGDAWTNLAQPFWAVPLLAIAGLRVRDIMGFCLVMLLASGLVLGLLFRFC